jgi:hypothetical protein
MPPSYRPATGPPATLRQAGRPVSAITTGFAWSVDAPVDIEMGNASSTLQHVKIDIARSVDAPVDVEMGDASSTLRHV